MHNCFDAALHSIFNWDRQQRLANKQKEFNRSPTCFPHSRSRLDYILITNSEYCLWLLFEKYVDECMREYKTNNYFLYILIQKVNINFQVIWFCWKIGFILKHDKKNRLYFMQGRINSYYIYSPLVFFAVDSLATFFIHTK